MASADRTTYDVCVIGGGVIGCTFLFHLARAGKRCVLLESEDNLITGASSGNSGMLHCGFDTTPGTLESQLVLESRKLNKEMYTSLGIPLVQCGALMVAWDSNQNARLEHILQKARSLGLTSIRRVSQTELFAMEPHLSREAEGALHVPEEYVAEPLVTPLVLAHLATEQGALVRTGWQVSKLQRQRNGTWLVVTSQGSVEARQVINAAGLYGDTVDELAGRNNFRIHPRLGQYAVYSRTASHLIKRSVLPVPTEKTKGIILFQTVHGNIVIGPTAQDVTHRKKPRPDAHVHNMLVHEANRIVPTLSRHSVVGAYVGVRPATEEKDYRISVSPDRSWVTVGGIRSTGLTASQAICRHVLENVGIPYPSAPFSVKKVPRVQFNAEKRVVLIEGTEYAITHPITNFGLERSTGRVSKL